LFLGLYTYRLLNGVLLSSVGNGVKEFVQGLEFLVLIHLIAKGTRTPEKRAEFLRMLYVGSGVIAVLVAAWHVANGQVANYKDLGAAKMVFAFFGLFAVTNYMSDDEDATGLPLVVAALLLVVLSGERKGWVALLGASVVAFAAKENISIVRFVARTFSARVLGATALVAVLLVGAASQAEYVSRQVRNLYDLYGLFSQINLTASLAQFEASVSQFETSGSNLVRLYLLLFSIHTVAEHPVFGVGTGRWKDVLSESARNLNSDFTTGAHNEYQRFAVENGLIGFAMYATSWILIIRSASRWVRSAVDVRALTVLGLAVFGAIINLFLGGGALNIVYWALAVGLTVGAQNDDTVTVRL
jgi:hypothetical protein